MGLLPPRSLLSGNPQYDDVQVNCDGSRIAFKQYKAKDLVDICVIEAASAEDLTSAKRITDCDTKKRISDFIWTAHPNVLVFTLNAAFNSGTEIWALDTITLTETLLTPTRGSLNSTQSHWISLSHPNQIIIASNKRKKTCRDLYLVDIWSGEWVLLVEFDEGFTDVHVDLERGFGIVVQGIRVHRIEFAVNVDMSSSTQNTGVTQTNTSAKTFLFETLTLSNESIFEVLGYDAESSSVLMLSNDQTEMAALYAFNINSKEKKLLGYDDKSDITGILRDSATSQLLAFQSEPIFRTYTTLLPSASNELTTIQNSVGEHSEFTVHSQSRNGKMWILRVAGFDSPISYWIYNRQTSHIDQFLSTRPGLLEHQLGTITTRTITTRDGFSMTVYITVPPGMNGIDGNVREPLPAVLEAHGGPHYRPRYGFSSRRHLFATRGYIVILPMFRGTPGFGKKWFMSGSGYSTWLNIQNDINDSVKWSIEEGLVIKEKIAFYGESFGGYSALYALTKTPEVFACAISFVGFADVRQYASRDKRDLEYLTSISPIVSRSQIAKPLLIGQGGFEKKSIREEMKLVFETVHSEGIPATFALFPDEGHFFKREVNNIAAASIVESFLSSFLGGAAEPVGCSLMESSVQITGVQLFIE
ncbi:hypothetical protein HDU79_000170 [Rhizoclosmatium sp. JEL0117]|nr:hypothetical protein HDU79_000170 [Rhizoclosmatium sp. JEL0117]